MVERLNGMIPEVHPQDYSQYNPLVEIRKRRLAQKEELALRKKRALRIARRAAGILREKFGARSVVLYGSLAKKSDFTLWSDIDLAASGIAPQRFYSAVAAVTGMSSEFKIDLVDSDSCRTSLKSAIDKEGITL